MKITATDANGSDLKKDIISSDIGFLDLADLDAVWFFGEIDYGWICHGFKLTGRGLDRK